ncbi:MAG TPA: carboxylating nicotinate-nucleotide diphosphorylase [Candidatus Dormibacteraeota bacterium]
MTATLEHITDALAPEYLDTLIETALREDVGAGDITTDAIVAPEMTCRGKVVCKEDGVAAGMPVLRRVFELVDERIQVDVKVTDGDRVQDGTIVARLAGPARGILAGERVSLNFLQHLSGIASLTARYVKAVEGTKCVILDTRKTTPGLRLLEKYATRTGGATNHRMGLYDDVLVKDTHLALANGVTPALRAIRRAHPEAPINVEVSNLQELEQALADRAPRLLLDNFSPGQVREAMQMIRGRARVEISGGVSLTNARAFALAGADYISVGALTHSATALDFSLKVTRY